MNNYFFVIHFCIYVFVPRVYAPSTPKSNNDEEDPSGCPSDCLPIFKGWIALKNFICPENNNSVEYGIIQMNVLLYDKQDRIQFNGSPGVIVTSDCDNEYWCNLKVLAPSSPEQYGSRDTNLQPVHSFRVVDMRDVQFDGKSILSFSLADDSQARIKIEFTQEKVALKFHETISKVLES